MNFLLLLFSRSAMSNSLRSHGLQHLHHLLELLRRMSIQLIMRSNHLMLCCPLLLLPSILPSIRIFSNDFALRIRQSKYWNFSFSTSPSSEYSELMSFRIDWFDHLAVQGTFKNPLQQQFKHISSLALSLLCGPALTAIHDYWNRCKVKKAA